MIASACNRSMPAVTNLNFWQDLLADVIRDVIACWQANEILSIEDLIFIWIYGSENVMVEFAEKKLSVASVSYTSHESTGSVRLGTKLKKN